MAWREAGIGGDLTPIGEGPEQPFQPQHGRELGPDAFEREQHRRRRWRLTALLGQQRVTFGLDGLDLSKQQFETIELAG
jgi:hypothetical protein